MLKFILTLIDQEKISPVLTNNCIPLEFFFLRENQKLIPFALVKDFIKRGNKAAITVWLFVL